MQLLACRDGQLVVAVAAWVLTRCSIASRLSRRPVRVGNSGSAGRPARSASQAASTAWAGTVSGTALCFRPLPSAEDVRAGAERDVAAVQGDELGDSEPGVDREGEQRRSRRPSHRARSGAAISAAASAAVRNVMVRCRSRRLGGIASTCAIARRVLGVEGRVFEQRADRCQSQVAGLGGVVAVGLEVIEESRRSAVRRGHPSRARTAPCRSPAACSGVVAAACRGRRRSCVGWPAAAASDGR